MRLGFEEKGRLSVVVRDNRRVSITLSTSKNRKIPRMPNPTFSREQRKGDNCKLPPLSPRPLRGKFLASEEFFMKNDRELEV